MATGTPTPQAPATALRFRRSASRLTAGQLTALRDAFARTQAIDDDRGYGFFAGIHGLPLPIGCDAAHNSVYFLPWHRAYLYTAERILRDQNADAMLTWWDWRISARRPAQIPEIFAQERSGRTPNPLHDAAVDPLAIRQGGREAARLGPRTVRDPGAPGAPSLPRVDEVNAVLAISDFGGFSAQLEGLHNRVHVWVGGHMGQIPFAAFDPIFWAHHAMIDRVWRLWQLKHSGGRPPAAILDEALPPFRMTVRQTLDVTALGYDYAVQSASAAPAPAPVS